MRITDRMIYDGAQRSTLQARARADRAALVAGTGLQVVHPGDAPTAMGAVVAGRAAQARFESIRGSVESTRAQLEQADAALGSVATMVRRAEQLAVQLANGTWGATERAAAAAEVDSLARGITAALNAEHAGRFLFGGTADTQPPWAADGTWHGTAGSRQVEVAPGVFEDVTLRPDVAIGGAGGGSDLFASLRALAAALAADDPAAVAQQIDVLGAAQDQIAAERARIGGSAGVLEAAAAASLEARDAAQAEVARLTEADVVAAASELALSQRALEAALAAASESFRLTLLDRL
ncbi:flagellar biosynthesis protein FlgL [Vulgatibacter sp.]|uniref:flagellin N-terminal helical domain-containing protein n=1 Tax=Vulgatibacter sp. TaxID=1971226 RepID=UPI003563A5A5